MKKTLLILSILFLSTGVYSQPFSGSTKHRPVECQKKRDTKKVKNGGTMYFRDQFGTHKNTVINRVVSKIKTKIK